MHEILVDVKKVKKYYTMKSGLIKKRTIQVKAVDDVSFSIFRGEILGLVGESGSGKTTLARLIMRLTKPTENSVYFEGEDIFEASGMRLEQIRKKMGIVFQDPAASLNPRSTIRATLRRPLVINGQKGQQIRQLLKAIIAEVNLGETYLRRYPHMLSGGQQQRVSVARALVLRPRFIVLDEPTSALDVSVQAQILNLLLEVQKTHGLTYLFISHDLNVVRYMSDRIGVMYMGKLIEIGPAEAVYFNPKHPYTLGLLSSAPILTPRARRLRRFKLAGEPPSMIHPPAGCRLHPRCPFVEDLCKIKPPALKEIAPGHFAACHRAQSLDLASSGQVVGPS